MEVIAGRDTNLQLLLIISLLISLCSLSQESPFDIEIKELTNSFVHVDAVIIANVKLPENTRFLWYFSPTRDPITWMLKGVGESLAFDYSQAEVNGLLNLTVIYPNGVRESVSRPMRKYLELEVDIFANGMLLTRGSRIFKLPIQEGEELAFECLFRGSPMNVKILLPNEMECQDQSMDAGIESISVRCDNLRFQKGQYGCAGQSEDMKLTTSVFLYGNAAQSISTNRLTLTSILFLLMIAWYVM
ncbi:unnamed protein product [Hymenolepis diminuta]|uniref:Ig-like domain-containing protein n=1 Tax=Hymenolepis diminuta TaxID=6216 RepID=A0A0R3SQY6_HYMDI|nr:unnamed protein product [Hymenolepis diminuta]